MGRFRNREAERLICYSCAALSHMSIVSGRRIGYTENIEIYVCGLTGCRMCREVSMETERRLPEAFLGRMEKLLGTEYEEFLASYGENRYYGLRYNPLKDSSETFAERIPYALEPVSWAEEGFYYSEEDQPGKDILHETGAYYIQEPSAMAVVQILDPKPGERILDLCAAPGGKTTQIAGRMGSKGLLVANEVIPGRAKILSQNVERMGIRNSIVCSEPPERMAALFSGYFDRIVVDAPCSGEGMFRKDEAAAGQWSKEQVQMCADRQDMILEEAAKMLKPGGVLVYSTCTFAPDENEGTISRFIKGHADYMIEEACHDADFASGRADWVSAPAQGLEHTLRLWPHRLRGEGHYIARLRRKGEAVDPAAAKAWAKPGDNHRASQNKPARAEEDRLQAFLTEELGLAGEWLAQQGGTVCTFGEQIYLVPEGMVPMRGLKVIRPGLHIGTNKKNRTEPSHSLALALKTEETDKRRELSREEAIRYVHGESLACGEEKGWILLTYRGYPIGFGKAVNGQMKNHYPKGLRK